MINKLFESKEKKFIPKWFLRQAGRHIPEYFVTRAKHKNFIDFCLNEKSILEATLLPLKYYNIDAAILFSDILHCSSEREQFELLRSTRPSHSFI